jgi:hypothetical protein
MATTACCEDSSTFLCVDDVCAISLGVRQEEYSIIHYYVLFAVSAALGVYINSLFVFVYYS